MVSHGRTTGLAIVKAQDATNHEFTLDKLTCNAAVEAQRVISETQQTLGLDMGSQVCAGMANQGEPQGWHITVQPISAARRPAAFAPSQAPPQEAASEQRQAQGAEEATATEEPTVEHTAPALRRAMAASKRQRDASVWDAAYERAARPSVAVAGQQIEEALTVLRQQGYGTHAEAVAIDIEGKKAEARPTEPAGQQYRAQLARLHYLERQLARAQGQGNAISSQLAAAYARVEQLDEEMSAIEERKCELEDELEQLEGQLARADRDQQSQPPAAAPNAPSA